MRHTQFYLQLILFQYQRNSLIYLTKIQTLMERSGLNIMVFDQQTSFMTDQSRVTHSAMRRQTSTPNYQTMHQSQQVISSQLKMLHDKIMDLQQKTSRLQQSMKTNIYPTSSSDISASNTHIQNNANSQNVNASQIDQLLKVIEQKMQIVIRQTKKIIEKLTNDFDRKITQINSQKTHQKSSIVKIQNHYQQAISKMEDHYKQNLKNLQKKYTQSQKSMLDQVQQIQNQFKVKKRQFQSKQQEYIGTIQHLENKLKIVNKNKKMLEVTQEKKNAVIKCNILENINGHINIVPEMNGLPPANDTSQQRRRRIFDGRSSNRSISPNSQVLSPLKTNTIQKQTQSVAKVIQNKNDQMPETQFSRNEKNDHFQLSQTANNRVITAPVSSKYCENSQKINQYSRQSEVQYQQRNSQKQSSTLSVAYGNHNSSKNSQQYRVQQNNYIDNKIASVSKNVQIKSPIAKARKNQGCRETPKGQWERFQDFHEHESSGSQEDVFFYPEHVRNQGEEPHVVFDYADNQSHKSSNQKDKLFSPFDLN